MSRTNTPLSLVPIKEIMQELQDRYDHIVFASGKNWDEVNDQEYSFYAGHPTFCLGLTSRLTNKINVDVSDELQDLDD